MGIVVVVAIGVLALTGVLFFVGVLKKNVSEKVLTEPEIRQKLAKVNGKGAELAKRSDVMVDKNKNVVEQIIKNNEVLKKAKAS
ncbi:MAG: hypothetical protein HC892_06270 [Saprospiraceae bacterium]|nr:hypothetical protein [Saprospiraceae bacterium]